MIATVISLLLQQADGSPSAAKSAVTQSPEAQTSSIRRASPIDAAKLEPAKRIADAVWPVGTFARMYATGAGLETADAILPGLLKVAKDDPHFGERMAIMNRLMAAEMAPIAASREPFIRAALAEAYARRFDLTQLQAAATFFATSAGRAVAAETHLLLLDPALVRLITPSLQDTIRIMVTVSKKLDAATKHLPKSKRQP